MSNLYTQATSGNPISASEWNANFLLAQNSVLDIGQFVISGLVPSAGAGLAVSVTAGVASIGARVTAAATFSIAGLTDATTNHLYLLDTGVGSSNTTGTQPANSVKLGTATCAAGAVTSVNVLRSSGRQTLVRHENLIAGAVGSPGSISLAAWNATAGDGFQVYGSLPAGSLPAIAFDDLSDVTLTSQAQGNLLYRNATVWVNLAAGASGQFLKTLGAGANPVWGAPLRGAVAILCDAFTPAGTGADVGEIMVPYSTVDGTTSITWNVRRIWLRVSTAGGAPVAVVEKSTATGVFSAATVGTLTMGSGNSEVAVTASLGTVASGNKLRFNVTTLGSATGWSIGVEMGE